MKFFEKFGFSKRPESEELPTSEKPETRKSPVGSPQEKILAKGEIGQYAKLLGGAIGSATFIKIKDDGAGVFKPHRGHEAETRSLYANRERAAYLIDRFLGFNFVPPTVIRNIKSHSAKEEQGSFQEFVDSAKIGYEVRSEDIPPEEYTKLKIFDSIIRNNDRNDGNYLLKEGKIFAIDHGFSLAEKNAADSTLSDKVVVRNPLPKPLLENLRRFSLWLEGKQLLTGLLAEALGKETAEAYMKRIDAFIASISKKGFVDPEVFKKELETRFNKVY